MLKNIIARILGISGSIWNYIETYVFPVLKSAAGTVIVQLAPVALQAVKDANAKGGSNQDKFNYAFDQIKAAAVANGVAVGTSVFNKLVEDAYQQLKASGDSKAS